MSTQPNGKNMPLCIGLTGGIGCGKSTVAMLFEQLGVTVIDTDAIARTLTQPDGLAMPRILSTFGSDFLTPEGALNRAKLRQLIFADAVAKTNLEAILHPLILEVSNEQIRACTDTPYVILMAPLLLEVTSFLLLVQRVLLVDCSEDLQVSRVQARSQLDESEIRTIIAQQISRAERLAQADDIIQNNGTRENLNDQVFALHQQYLGMLKKINI